MPLARKISNHTSNNQATAMEETESVTAPNEKQEEEEGLKNQKRRREKRV